MLEEIVSKDNMKSAYDRVVGNKGCAGVDGMEVSELKPYLKTHWHRIKASIQDGTYRAQPVKGVEIDKPKGGKRLLGIPTVLDRLIQQAIQQVLNGIFDPKFSAFSYGFRKGKSAHQAIKQALEYANTGSHYVGHMELLGYGIYRMRSHKFVLKVLESNWQKFVRKSKMITRKSHPVSYDERVAKLKEYCIGWIGYFRYANIKTRLIGLDRLLGSRLRYCIWKSWKRIRTRIRNLIKLGLPEWFAVKWGFTRRGGWHVVQSPILQATLTNERLQKLGFLPTANIYGNYCHV